MSDSWTTTGGFGLFFFLCLFLLSSYLGWKSHKVPRKLLFFTLLT